jgi:hypothetical protein
MFCTTNRLYLKNFLVFLLPFLLLSLAACGGSGSSGGSSDVGKTAAIEMSSGAETLPARSGSTWIEVQLTDSTGNPVDQDTRVVFRTNIGTFSSNRDQKETSRETADESGVIRVTLHAPYDPGVAEVEAESIFPLLREPLSPQATLPMPAGQRKSGCDLQQYRVRSLSGRNVMVSRMKHPWSLYRDRWIKFSFMPFPTWYRLMVHFRLRPLLWMKMKTASAQKE